MNFFLIICLVLFQNGWGYVNIIKHVETSLERVLSFTEKRIDTFGFDGFFGIALAQTQLIEILEFSITGTLFKDVQYFIDKCQSILTKSKRLLPKYPSYMVTFEKKLLNSQKWLETLPRKITYKELPDLGIYETWSVEQILKNKRANFKGKETDVCLREILELTTNHTCYLSSFCEDMMLNLSRIDTGYLLTHRLLYIQIQRLQGCFIAEDLESSKDFTRFFCSYMLKEAKTNEYLQFPYHDIFLEQTVLCGMEGYSDFINKKWLKSILNWQNPDGCYESVSKNVNMDLYHIQKRTSQIFDNGCTDHSTGLGTAALALYFKYLLI